MALLALSYSRNCLFTVISFSSTSFSFSSEVVHTSTLPSRTGNLTLREFYHNMYRLPQTCFYLLSVKLSHIITRPNYNITNSFHEVSFHCYLIKQGMLSESRIPFPPQKKCAWIKPQTMFPAQAKPASPTGGIGTGRSLVISPPVHCLLCSHCFSCLILLAYIFSRVAISPYTLPGGLIKFRSCE